MCISSCYRRTERGGKRLRERERKIERGREIERVGDRKREKEGYGRGIFIRKNNKRWRR